MISSNWDHNHNHYRFARTHTGQAPEPAAPISSWSIEIIRLLGIGAYCAAFWLLCWALT